MAVSEEEIAYATDLFSGLGGVNARKMMGGLSLYCDGTIFAILHKDHGLMIKGAGGFEATLEAQGGHRWTHTRADGKTVSMPYWSLPPACEDDPDAACALARAALRHLR